MSIQTRQRPQTAEFARPDTVPVDESRTFAQAVQARLADDILNGRLTPGMRLRLQSLCDTYQVSMSPLREALSGLTGRGLVIQEGQRGFRVAPISANDLSDITESRIHIECLALGLAIDGGGHAWEASILAAHHSLSRSPRSDDLLIDEVWEDLHRAYHISLIAACGRSRLLGFYRTLSDNFDRYRRFAVLTAGRHPRVKSLHGAIVKATLARNTDRARQLLAEHVRDSAAQIVNLLGEKTLQRLSRPE